MAKIVKRVLAVIIALSMCAGQLCVTAMAAETTGSGTPSDPYVTEDTATTPTEDGGSSTTTTTQREWSEEVTTTPDSQSGGSDGGTDSETTTAVQGGETTTETTETDGQGRVVEESGATAGSERIDTTKTTTETTTTEEVVNGENGEGETTGSEEVIEQVDGEPERQEGETTQGEPTNHDQWTETDTTDHDFSDWETTPGAQDSSERTEADVDEDPLKGKDITIDLAPGKNGGNAVTVKEYIDLTRLVEDNIGLPAGLTGGSSADPASHTETVGNVTTTYTAVYATNEEGQEFIVGYEKVAVTTSGSEGDPAVTRDNVETGRTTVETQSAPEGYTEGVVESEGDNGEKVVVKTEAIYDPDDPAKIIGYTVTTITTTPTTTDITTVDSDKETVETEGEPVVTFTLPERPAEGQTTDADTNQTTTVVVEEIVDPDTDEVIGYRKTRIVTDQNGTELSRASESIYGTTTTVNEKTIVDPTRETTTTGKYQVTTKVETIIGVTVTDTATLESQRETTVTTTEVKETESYMLVEVDGGLYFLYRGEMYEVLAQGDHGDVTMTSIQPNISGLEPGTKDGAVSSSTLLRNPENFDKDNGIADGFEFEYVAYGLETAVTVAQNGKNTLAHQFVLVDREGNKHYVLCADLGTNAVRGADYNMVNVGSANYYKRDGAAEKIEAIALSGYWGTSSGLGSFEQVKAFMSSAGISETHISNLTEGAALTATQAAIWYYGNSSASKTMHDQAVTGAIYKSNGTTRAATAAEASALNALYRALININASQVTNNTTTLIEKEHFAQEASITIKAQAANDDGSVKTDTNGNEKYQTAITFTLEVTPSAENDDLIVVVKQGGEVVATRRLTNEKTGSAYNAYGKIDQNDDGSYTIDNLELAEGVKVTLNLEGTQQLEQGVYLYSAAVYSNTQTFVGISSGERDVNLAVDLKFEVERPEAHVLSSSGSDTRSKTDVRTESKVETRADVREDIISESDSETVAYTTENVKVYASVTVIENAVDASRIERNWSSSWSDRYTYPEPDPDPDPDPDPSNTPEPEPEIPEESVPLEELPDDEIPLEELPDDEIPLEELPDDEIPLEELPDDEIPLEELPDDEIPLEELPDDEIPLADLPETGDHSMVWFALSLLSGVGLAGLKVFGKKGDDEE